MPTAARHLLVLRNLILLSILFAAIAGHGQEPKQKETPSAGGGVSTGARHAAVKDSQSRPITAGGFVDNAPIVFTDITKQAGLDKFHHRSGTAKKESIIETPGSGVALLDYDNDGWLDIYVANYGKNRLYHNNHDGTFTDVAEKAGVTLGGWSTGPTWGDYDHDGLLDLFVPGYVKFDADHPPIAGQGKIPPNFCQFRGIAVMCGPRGMT